MSGFFAARQQASAREGAAEPVACAADWVQHMLLFVAQSALGARKRGMLR